MRSAFRSRALVLAALAALGVASARADDPVWESLGESDGVKVWRAEIEGSPVVAMKGTGDVDASVLRIASVIYDTPRCGEWAGDLSESRVVRLVSDQERIVYQRVSTPWPVSDREVLFDARATFDPKNRSLLFRMTSTEDASVTPNPKCVRSLLHLSTFDLVPLDDAHTRLTVEVHADPMGSIPKSIVNFFQKTWPRDTIKGIRKQVKKTDVVDLPSVAAILTLSKSGVAPVTSAQR